MRKQVVIVALWLAAASVARADGLGWTVQDRGLKARLRFDTVPAVLRRRLAGCADTSKLVLAALTVDNRTAETTYVVDPDGLVEVLLKDGRTLRSVDVSWQAFWMGERGLAYLMAPDRVDPLSDRKWLVAFKESFDPEEVRSITVTVARARPAEADPTTPDAEGD